MTNRKWMSLIGGIAVCLAAVLSAAPDAHAQIAELTAQKIKLSIDPKDIAVSGISSGAAMAHQLHIAHSKDLAGAGLVAGPPFRCAEYLQGNVDILKRVPQLAAGLNAQTAIGLCTAYYKKMGPLFAYLADVDALSIEPKRLQELVADAETRGTVDGVKKGMCGDKVFIINGEADETVPAKVTGATADLYRSLLGQCGGNANVGAHLKVETRPGMPHTMPTDSKAEPGLCAAGPPYIADCDYPGPTEMLRFLHPKRVGSTQANRPADPKNLIAFDQTNVIGRINPQGLMHKNGYIYVPEACKKGQTCGLHVALHGCHQNEDQINKDAPASSKRYLFHIDAGYNETAERAGIVVLYPQADATDQYGRNPNGCWDWWGYNGPGFYQKDGMQLRNIWKIVNAVVKLG